jgi:hypothetical protein
VVVLDAGFYNAIGVRGGDVRWRADVLVGRRWSPGNVDFVLL